ncbi:FecR family protein [Saccharicrinis aurantiacus]|uniref:FecR family protein n=1 Tax=Saccharicrinis aurantiacus TaxID=1849719 RepID=UPI000838037E|nr:FecR family protein [Saccharicrinis aurantiacus]
MDKNNIDYHILWKKFNASVSKQEQQLIDDWRRVSPKQEQLYKDVEAFYSEDSINLTPNLNQQEAFKNISNRINKRRWYSISAAASVILILGLSVLYLQSKIFSINEPTIIAQNSSTQITHGEKKAVLILEDGTEAVITPETQLEVNQGSSSLQLSESGLSYKEQKSKSIKESFNTLMIPRGGEFYLELSDGTKVWLNSETKLKYPVAFVNDQRVVELTGEAYFEVAKDKEHPFIVLSGNQKVKVLGTQFNVNNYDGNPSIKTTLVEGAVEVVTNSGESIKLNPGYQSVYDINTSEIASSKVNVSECIAWKNGIFQFSDETLVQMLGTLERWYDVSFNYKNDVLKNIRFTGKMKRYESLEEVLAIIAKTNEVSFTVEGSQVFVN